MVWWVGFMLGLLALGAAFWVLAHGGRRARSEAARLRKELELAQQQMEVFKGGEQRWQLLFEQSPLSVQLFAPNGQTMRFNDAWRRLFRLSDEQGYAFNVLKDPDLNASGAVQLIRRAFEGEVVHVPPVRFPVPGDPNDYRWIGGLLYPVMNAKGEILEVVTIHNDITERVLAEEAMNSLNQTLERKVKERTSELEQARAELAKALEAERELGELKTRFVSMVSHEFRTPMGVIMSSIEILRLFNQRIDDAKRSELFADIHEATRGMSRLVEEILDLGRMEAGRIEFRPEPMDIRELLIRIVSETTSATYDRCPVLLEFNSLPDGFHGDKSLLRRILGNLIHNAVKYSPDSSPVHVSVKAADGAVEFLVQDKGIGIPEADMPKLFQAFHRARNIGEIPGSGLGLVIVKRCVELHGGRVEVTSSHEAGTCFSVLIPHSPAIAPVNRPAPETLLMEAPG